MKLLATCSLALFSAFNVAAAPLSDSDDTIDAVTSTIYNRLYIGANFAASAYCKANTAPGASVVACNAKGTNICTKASGAKIFGTFNDSGNATGYVATLNNQVIVAFRGTTISNITDIIENLHYDQVASGFQGCSGCLVHDGFLTGWQAVRTEVLGYVDAALAGTTMPIFVIGHSLGAALATFAAVDIKAHVGSGVKTTLLSYASPRLGNPAFATWYESNSPTAGPKLDGVYRVTHYEDQVPRVPKPTQISLLGTSLWQHFGPEYFIDADALADQTASVIDEKTKGEDPSGNSGTAYAYASLDEYLLDEHRHYLIQVSGGNTSGC